MKSIITAAAIAMTATAASADQIGLQSMDTTVAALGGLEVAPVQKGEWGFGAGVGATYADSEYDTAGAVGVNYGLSDKVTMSVKAARSFTDETYSAFAGVAFKF